MNRRSTRKSAQSAAVALIRAARAVVEGLEERRLFSTIHWVNEGSAGNDSDAFEQFYGANAEAARDCVRAAVSAWERVIVDFNRADGSNTFELDISATDFDDGMTAGETNVTCIQDGMPVAATIEFDDDGAGGGWFFDPTPGVNEECTTIQNISAADAEMGNAADYCTTVLHEIGHAMGIAGEGGLKIWDILHDTGTADPDDPDGDELLTFNGLPNNVLTCAGGLHVWAGLNAAPPYVGHEFDLMTTSGGFDERRLISPFDAYVLKVAYGYTIQDPAGLPDQQLIAVTDPSTRALTINGNCDPSVADDITLASSGSELLVTTGLHTVHIPLSEFDSIEVVAATLAGNSTTLTLDMSGGDMVPLVGGITFDGGVGDDTLNVDLRNGGEFPAGSVRFEGQGGADVLHVYGHQNEQNEMHIGQWGITLGATTSVLTTAEITVESVVVEGGADDDEIAVDFTPASATADFQVLGNEGNDDFVVARSLAAFTTVVSGGKGDDTLTIGNIYHNLAYIAGDVHFAGDDGFDRLFLDNSTDQDDVTYNLTATSVVRPLVPSTITHFSTEERTLEAGEGKNTINIVSVAQFTTTNVHAAGGDDTIIVDSAPDDPQAGSADEVRGTVVIDGGGGGANTLLIRDDHDASGDVCTITDDSIGAAVGDNFFGYTGSLKYQHLGRIDILGAAGTSGVADSFAVVSTSEETDQFNIWGGRGGDAFVVGGTNGKSKTGTLDNVRSPLHLFGLERVVNFDQDRRVRLVWQGSHIPAT